MEYTGNEISGIREWMSEQERAITRKQIKGHAHENRCVSISCEGFET